MSSSYHKNIDGALSTVDATATTVVTFPCDNISALRAEISVIAISPDNNNQKTWEMLVLCKRLNGGVVVTGSLTNLFTPIGDVGAATWTIQASTSSTNLLVQVVGQASTKINWFVSVWGMCVVED